MPKEHKLPQARVAFSSRWPKELYEELHKRAEYEGISINALTVRMLENAVRREERR
jgi:predicted HicB family RNase H-like nuclease